MAAQDMRSFSSSGFADDSPLSTAQKQSLSNSQQGCCLKAIGNRKRTAIVLVAIGSAVVLSLLAMAIYSERNRVGAELKLAKLILISVWDKRSPDEEAAIIRETYGSFLKLYLDVDMAHTENGLPKLVKLEALLNLTHMDEDIAIADGARPLENEQNVFDTLATWSSPENTELDQISESKSKQLDYMTVSSQEMKRIMERLGSNSTPDLVAIEAWLEEGVKIRKMDSDRNSLDFCRQLASLEILRQSLCPASTVDDSHCKLERE